MPRIRSKFQAEVKKVQALDEEKKKLEEELKNKPSDAPSDGGSTATELGLPLLNYIQGTKSLAGGPFNDQIHFPPFQQSFFTKIIINSCSDFP